MEREYTTQENAEELWNAATKAIQAAKEGQLPRILGQTTVNSVTSDRIILRHDYDGAWRDVERTLTLAHDGPVSFRYRSNHWGEGCVEADNEDITHGPYEAQTLEWLASLASNVRKHKE